jgi:hypothetical protein
LPRELGLNETLGGQRLHNLDDFEVGNIEIGVLGKVIILGGDKGTIYKLNKLVFNFSVELCRFYP